MSDEDIRAAERTYRASGSPQDGEAWVQVVLRSAGLNSTFLIARVIESQRALAAMFNPMDYANSADREDQIRRAFRRPVTPDDMVSFLRGGREWLNPPTPLGQNMYAAMIDEHNFDCRGPDCDVMVLVGGRAVRCSEHRADPNAHLPHQRGVPAGSAILCNHANENPGHCPCEPDCYCRQNGHTCSDVDRVYNDGRGAEPGCRLCKRDARWRFNTDPHFFVCDLHLSEVRVNRALPVSQRNYIEMMQRSSAHMDSLTFPPPMPPSTPVVERTPASENVLWHGDGCDTNMQGQNTCPKCGIPPSMQDTFLAPVTWTAPPRCADSSCNRRLPAGHTAIYCSANCALNDA